MLKISRNIGESVLIGQDILITVYEKRDKGICLAIEAPREVPIYRTELLLKRRYLTQAETVKRLLGKKFSKDC